MTDEKRKAALLVPYRTYNGKYEVFLQKRTANARSSPNMYGLFGGGIEPGESIEEALLREIKEELQIEIEVPEYFGEYEGVTTIHHVFALPVPEYFKDIVVVLEGEYGEFYSFSDVAMRLPISTTTRRILQDLESKLAQK